jgi:pilus assembly protein Flp/PilA
MQISITGFLRNFLVSEDGATAIEYALIAGGIFVAIITVVYEVGPVIEGIFIEVNSGF